MKLLPEESLRLRVCMQLQEDALTKVLPVIARTCHLQSLFWSWVFITYKTFCRYHDPFTFLVTNAFTVFSDLGLHYSILTQTLKQFYLINKANLNLPTAGFQS